jgi:hypothetical protein
MTEDDLRTMLQRRARDVRPSPDAWDRVAARLEAPAPRRSYRWVAPVLSAAALVAVAVTAGVATRDRDETGVVAQEPPTTQEAPVPAALPVSAIWPAATAEGLEQAQAAADAGDRPDYLDPVGVVDGYLFDRGLRVYEILDFQQGDATSGEVPYRFGDGASGTVLLRRYEDRPDGIWTVIAAVATDLAVGDVSYDGEFVDGRITPAATGGLDVTIRPADGSDPVLTDPRSAVAGQPIDLHQRFAGGPAVLLQLSLTGGDGLVAFAEERVSAPVTSVPPSTSPLPPVDFAAIWPVVEEEALAVLDERAATEQPRELVDAAEVVRRWFGDEPVTIGDTNEGALDAVVEVTTADGVLQAVQLAKSAAAARAWYVTGMVTERLAGLGYEVVDSNGADRIDVRVVPQEAGTVSAVAIPLHGPTTVPAEAGTVERALAAGQRFTLEVPLDGPAGQPYLLLVRHTAADGTTARWVERIG